MNKIFKIFLCIVFLLNTSLMLYSDCATQNENSVTLEVNITTVNADIHTVTCGFTFTSGLAGATYQIESSGTYSINGSISPGNNLYSDNDDFDVGYYVELSTDVDELIIRRNPVDVGTFGSSDITTWKLIISNITGSYEITDVNTTPRNISGGGAIDTASGVFTFCNTKPTVTGLTAPASAATELTFEFEAIGADAEDPSQDSIVNYEWNYGNSATSTETDNPHDYTYPLDTTPADGTFNVTVRVQDNHGAWSDWTSAVEVSPNQRPTLTGINTPILDTVTPLKVTLSANTPNDPDNDTIEYLWNFGDGNSPATPPTDNTPISHTYSTDNIAGYTVTLQLRDPLGFLSTEESITANPDNRPVIDSWNLESGSLSPTTPERIDNIIYASIPAVIELSAISSDDSDSISQLSWDMNGDGDFIDPADINDTTTPFGNQSVTYQDVGAYKIGIRSKAGNLNSVVTTIPIYILPDENMHFARATGLPYDSGKSPFIDGKLNGEEDGQLDGGIDYGENGWRGAYKQVYGTGVVGRDFIFQGIRDNIASNNTLYFSFEISYDDVLNSNDEIVLGFRGNSDDPLAPDTLTDRLVRIDPSVAVTGDATGNASSAGIQVYEREGDGWSTTANASTPPGLVCAKQPLSDNTWTIEIAVPMDGDAGSGWNAINSQFLFFFNIKRTINGGVPTIDYGRWPTALDIAPVSDFFIDDTSHIDYEWPKTRFNPMWWGKVDMDTSLACNGLSFTSSANVGAIPVDTEVNPGYDAEDLAANGSLTSSFKYNKPLPNNFSNIIVARVENDTHIQEIDGGGNIVKRMLNVPNVSVSFKLANWGIPPEFSGVSYWEDITGSPTSAKTVPKGEDPATGDPYIEPFYFEWVIPDSDINNGKYEYDSSDSDNMKESHQCMYVEIHAEPNSSTNPDDINNPRIVTKSVHRNMNFNAENAAEQFTHQADISALGYGKALTENPNQKFLLRIYTRTWEVDLNDKEVKKVLINPKQMAELETGKEKEPAKAASNNTMSRVFYDDLLNQKNILSEYITEGKNKISYIEYIVKGFLYTGKTTTINGEKMAIVRSVGSYGHQIRHIGPVEDWSYKITGTGVKKLDNNTYLLEIAPESTKRIYDNVKALEPPKWRFHLSGGAIFPIKTFADNYKIGPNFIVGAGYYLNPQYSFHLLFGYNYLYSNSSGVNDTTLMSLSLNARRHFPLGTKLSWYAGIGGGAYFDTDSNVETGGNVGAGINLRLSRYLELEAGADYHYMIASQNQYIHGHAGALFRF